MIGVVEKVVQFEMAYFPGHGPAEHIARRAALTMATKRAPETDSRGGAEPLLPRSSRFDAAWPARSCSSRRVCLMASKWAKCRAASSTSISPAAMTGYFDELAAALARSDLTDAELAKIAEAHHMHIVGPPSERYVSRPVRVSPPVVSPSPDA